MNEKFLRLRDEVLAEIGAPSAAPPGAPLAEPAVQSAAPPGDLPPVATEGLDPVALEDRQIRYYHLWERLKNFRAGDLEPEETALRDRLADHLQAGLTALHAAARPASRA